MAPKREKNISKVAIDIGGTKISAGFYSKDQTQPLHAITHIWAEQFASYESVSEFVYQLIEPYLDDDRPTPVGISCAGPLNAKEGRVYNSTNLQKRVKGAGVWSLKEDLDRLSAGRLTVQIQNDAVCGLLAEIHFGKLHGVANGLFVSLGTGLGVGVLINKQPLVYESGWTPELGHVSLGPSRKGNGSALCGCGSPHCAEIFVSGSAFSRSVREDFGKDFSNPGEEALKAFQAHQSWAIEAFHRFSQNLALALESYCRIFYPEKMIIGGGFSKFSEAFLSQTQEHLEKSLRRPELQFPVVPEIGVSDLGPSSCLLGARALLG